MKTIDLVIAIIFTVVAALEAFGVVACWKATRRLVRLYSFAAIACAVLAVGGGLLAFIFNFIFKVRANRVLLLPLCARAPLLTRLPSRARPV